MRQTKIPSIDLEIFAQTTGWIKIADTNSKKIITGNINDLQ